MSGRDWRRFGRYHAKLLRLTRARCFNSVGQGRKVLLLETVGRKTGLPRAVPLVFMHDPDTDALVLFASNGGQERPPAWWLNLEATPECEVLVAGQRRAMRARAADADTHGRLWPHARAYNDHWRQYEETTERDIPLVVLTPR